MKHLIQTINSLLISLTLILAMSGLVQAETETFEAKLTIITTTIQVTEIKSLEFGSAYTGSNQNLKVDPADAGAAIFQVNGLPEEKIKTSIVENKVDMITGSGSSNETIEVSNFKIGGSVNNQGRGQLGTNGQLDNIRVGATANIKSANVSGNYQGTATFRAVYF